MLFKFKGTNISSTSDLASLLPYLKILNIIKKNINITSKSKLLSNQLIVLDNNSCNGLFFEDYLESLNLNVPHSLLKQCLKINESLKNEQKTTNFLLNSILVRENYKWKKSFTFQVAKHNKKEAEQKQQQKNELAKQQSIKVIFLNNSQLWYI